MGSMQMRGIPLGSTWGPLGYRVILPKIFYFDHPKPWSARVALPVCHTPWPCRCPHSRLPFKGWGLATSMTSMSNDNVTAVPIEVRILKIQLVFSLFYFLHFYFSTLFLQLDRLATHVWRDHVNDRMQESTGKHPSADIVHSPVRLVERRQSRTSQPKIPRCTRPIDWMETTNDAPSTSTFQFLICHTVLHFCIFAARLTTRPCTPACSSNVIIVSLCSRTLTYKR